MKMSTEEFHATLKELGMTQLKLAKTIDTHPNAISNWATGKSSIPGPAAAYLRLRLRVKRLIED